MSGGVPCRCQQKTVPITDRRWVVVRYKCNYSAFNGYRYAPSDYSEVTCEECRGTWRTKAAYVEKLRHES